MQCVAVMSAGAADHSSGDPPVVRKTEEMDTLGPLPVLRGSGQPSRSRRLSESLGFTRPTGGNAASAGDRTHTRRLALLDGQQSISSGYKLYEPKIVTFVRNGDRFFGGVKINVSQRNIRTFEVLLSELSRSIDLPSGVRQIYTPENGHRVTDLHQLEPQKIYVCASNEPFKKIDYSSVSAPTAFLTAVRNKPALPLIENAGERNAFSESLSSSTLSVRSIKSRGDGSSVYFPGRRKSRRLSSVSVEIPVTEHAGHLGSQMTPAVKRSGLNPSLNAKEGSGLLSKQLSPLKQADHTPPTQPVVLLIIRNGPPPRKSTNVLLNKSSISSWEQVRCLISDSLGMMQGCLRLFRLDGEEVRSLSQLWRAGNVLIAVGEEEFHVGEFMMGTTGKLSFHFALQFLSCILYCKMQQYRQLCVIT